MEKDFDYYLIEADGSYQAPSLMVDDDNDTRGLFFLARCKKLEDDNPSYLTFNPPYPKKPQMVDYHFCECRAVFSNKICDALKTKEIKNLQLVPAIIRDRKKVEYSNYYIANICQEYAFLDVEKSKGVIDEDDGKWIGIDSMVLEEEAVLKVPLEERQIFVSKESSAYVLYHKTIVDLIMSVNPIGLKFIPISEWYNGIAYKL